MMFDGKMFDLLARTAGREKIFADYKRDDYDAIYQKENYVLMVMVDTRMGDAPQKFFLHVLTPDNKRVRIVQGWTYRMPTFKEFEWMIDQIKIGKEFIVKEISNEEN